MRKWLACSLFILVSAGQAYAAQDYVFEKGDLLFRPKVWDVFDVEHTGIYLNSQSSYRFSADAAAQNNLPPINTSDGFHSIIHAPGYGNKYLDPSTGLEHPGIMITTLAGFLDTRGSDYIGSYEAPEMTSAQRHLGILAAGKKLGTLYTLFWGWQGTGDPPQFRCDGFARYVYAQMGFAFDEYPGGFLTNFPKDMRLQLGNEASSRAPNCGGPISISQTTDGYTLSVSGVKDDAFGSGIERVEFYNSQSFSEIPIGTDDHNSNPDAVTSPSTATVYHATVSQNPGSSIFSRVYDQAGNFAICDASGNRTGTSDQMQVLRNISRDEAPPTIGTIYVQLDPGGQNASVSWSGSDNSTPADQISYAYAIDVPFTQWDDSNVAIAGQVNTASIDISSLTEGRHILNIIALDQNGIIGSTEAYFVTGAPSITLIDSNQDGSWPGRIQGPFTGSTVTFANRLWLHNGSTALDGIRFQASSPGGVSALKIVGLDALGEPDESRLYADINVLSLEQEASFSDGTLPDAPGYLVSARAGSTTTVYFGVDSVPPTLSFSLNVSPTWSVDAVGISSDGTSGLVETVFSTWPMFGDQSRIGFGPPGLPQASFEFPIVQRVCGNTTCALGFIVAHDVSGLAAAFNPVYVSQEDSLNPIGGVGQWSPPIAIGGGVAHRLGEYQLGNVGGCPDIGPPGRECGRWSLKVRSAGLTQTSSTTVPITVGGAFIGEKVIADGPIISTMPFDVSGQFGGLLVGATIAMRFDVVDGPDPNFIPSHSGTGWYWKKSLLVIAENNPDAPVISTGIFPSVEAGLARVYFGEVAPGPLRRVWINQVLVTPPNGWRPLPGSSGLATDIATMASFTGGVHVRLRYNAGLLSPAQAAQVKMWHRGPSGWEDVTTFVDTANSEVWGAATTASPFIVLIPSAALGQSAASAASVAFVSSATVTLTWPAGSNPPGIRYFVTYATSPANSPCTAEAGAVLGAMSVFGETAEIGGLMPGSGYRFQVCNDALGAAGCATPVAVVTAQVGEPEQVSPSFLTCDGGQGSPDLTPPVTTLGFIGFFASTAGAAGIINDRSSVTLAAVDIGVGQVQTFYAINPSSTVLSGGLNAATTGAFSAYGVPFSLIPGRRVVAYGSVDGAGNYEILHSTDIVVEATPIVVPDTAPPRTVMSVGFPSATVDAIFYVTNASLLGFAATDDKISFGDGLGVGTTQTFYATDAGAFVPFTASFSLVAEGTHTVSYFSVDLVGNAEEVKIQALGVDLTAPEVTLVSSGTLYALIAEDPVVAGTASGVEGIQYVVDIDPAACDSVAPDTAAPHGTCANPDYSAPFELAPGTHTVAFMAVDRVGNEVLFSSFVTVAPVLTALAVTPSTDSIEVNATTQFAAAGTFSDGSTRTLTGAVKWRTDASTVAEVNASGLATGLAPGTALVIASSGAINAMATLTVRTPVLTALVVTPSTASIEVNAAAQFAAAGTFSDGSTRTMTGDVAWRTDALSVTTITASGLATGLSPGTALVIASSGAISALATLTVRIPVLTALAVTPSTSTVEAGDTAQFAAAGTFSDGSTRLMTDEVNWRTDALSVAEIIPTGLALGVGGGTAHVIASSDAISGQATLTVTLATPTVSSISPASAETGTSVAAAVVGTGFDNTAALSLERSDALRGTWAPTGSFTQGRYASTLTKLPDGRALLAGGIVGDATVGSAAVDLYDPATGLWTAGRPLNYGRNQYVAVTLNDGRVLVAGGYGAGSPLKSVEIYDPALSTWTIAAPMSSVRVWPQLAVLSDGRVLAAGGHNGASYLNSAEIYNPTTNVWSPAASMNTARAAAAMTRLSDGKMLAVGGFGDIATAEVYNPAANVWTPAGSMSVGRAVARSALLPNGKVLVSGGGGGGADVYDPATNAWTATSPMVTVRTVHALVLVNGTALAIGGENGATALATTEIYDAQANTWRSGPALMAPRTWLLQAVTLDDGRVLVAGGLASVGGAVLNTAELLGGAAVSIAATEVTVTDGRHLSGTLALTGAATGYWDVVVRETGGRLGRLPGGFQVLPRAPTLSSIAVTPAAAEIEVGATAQFTAAGTFSDGSTRMLTGEVAWTTDVSTVATVGPTGLALGEGGGTAHVIASWGAISGQAALTVRAPPPVVSSISPASAETGTSVAATVFGENFGTATAMSLERVSDVLRGTWTVTGSFAQGRYASTLTKLPDGRALLAGGIVGDTTVGSAAVDRYDPATGLWTAVAPLNQGRNQYVAVALNDGRVLVAGGYGSGSPTNSVEIYDPAHNTWTTAGPMATVRVWPQLAVLRDGRVLAAGGHNGASYLNSAEIYDPVNDIWTPTGSMNVARAGAAMVTLNDGSALAVGGFGDIATAEIFNPAANAWTPAGSMSVGRAIARSALLPSGKVLVSGGGGGGADVYDPAANTWTATNPMVTVRTVHALVLVNGTALAIGGENGATALASTEIYDAQANAWRSGPALTAPRTWLLQAVTLDDGRVLVAGGLASVGGAVLNTAELLGGAAVSIAATNVTVVDAQQLSGTLALTGAATGYWDVVVRETGGRLGRLTGGFQVLPRAPTLSAIAVTPSTAAIEVGATAQFMAAGTFTDGSTRTMTGEVAWTTDAPLVATFTAAGLTTGLAPGTAHVIASSGAVSAQAELTVRTPVLTALAVTPSTASILAGATVQFAAAGTFTDGSTRTMTGEVAWTTDFSTVATVGSTGLALGEGGGTAHVIASLGAIAGQATLNVAYVATSTGTVGGSPELTLVSTAPFSVVIASTETGAGAVALGSASVQGLVLVGTVYEVHREDLGAAAILTWYFDPALVDAATLAIWRFDGIAWSSVTVLNQVVTVTDGVGTVTGEVVLTSLFALFSRDISAPVTTLLVDGLPAGGASLSLVPTNAIGFAAVDAGVRETRYTLDGGAETVFVAPFRLAAGAHTLSYFSVDRADNRETARTVAIAVTNPSGDSAPPLVSLDFPGASALGVERAVGGVVSVRGSASDVSALTWTLSAGLTVLASGTGNVSGALAAWDTTALSGPQTLTLSAVDAYGNAATASAQVFVGAPVMTFAIGRKDSDAIVSTLKGPTGIAVRSDGAVWVASTENDKILLISPAGVLLGAAGQAPGHSGEDKESGKKEKKDKEDEDHDDKDRDDRNSDGPRFKSPQGLAVDAADHLYVADRDLNRVVKLSPDGQVLLLKIGKSGSGPGELNRPFDVAVDGNGDIYVADSGNRRISVFDAAGIFLRQFGQGALPAPSEVRGIALTSEGLWVSDKESERLYLFSRAGGLIKSIGGADSVVGEISRTRGLAADRLGALYVVEPNRDRTQKFDPQGKGLLAFGSKAGLSHADKLAKRYLTQPVDAAVAPDGSIWITDTGRDRIVRYALPIPGGYGVAALSAGGGAVSSSSIEPVMRVVDHKDGAKVERDDGAGVRVPKGALAADLEITVDKGDENQDKEQKTAKRRHMRIKAVSEEVQYGPEGTTFNTPVTLTVPYDANLIAAQGIREDELKVYYWNPGLKDWQAMPSTVDKQNKTVNAQTNHFSAYQVQGPGAGIGVAAAVDEFGLRDQYAFPNPSRSGAPLTFRIQPGLADSVEVRVYDVSGRKIHSSSDFRFSVLDDGNGKGAQNTYDHAWDVSGVGSGVYTYVIIATRAGQTSIIKSGKAGVIK